MIENRAMGIGDRVLVVMPKEFVNCHGIQYCDLTGTIIAKARNFRPELDLWLVLFDRDVCGLSSKHCDHDFGRHVRAGERAGRYTIVDGAIVEGRRNQRFFPALFLKPFRDHAVALEPRNNDGRTTCFWCGAPTSSVPGIFANYDVCTRCGK